MMSWHKDGPVAWKREDGQYGIYRAPQDGHVPPGFTVTFVLVDRFNHKIVGGRRNVVDEESSLANALRNLQEQAEALSAQEMDDAHDDR